jgi:hypothetical protein
MTTARKRQYVLWTDKSVKILRGSEAQLAHTGNLPDTDFSVELIWAKAYAKWACSFHIDGHLGNLKTEWHILDLGQAHNNEDNVSKAQEAAEDKLYEWLDSRSRNLDKARSILEDTIERRDKSLKGRLAKKKARYHGKS